MRNNFYGSSPPRQFLSLSNYATGRTLCVPAFRLVCPDRIDVFDVKL
jgi:hypothetical protein